MDGNTTDRRCTEAELREAGASESYISYYTAAKEMGIETASTAHAEEVVNEGVEYSGGGFHDSLWNAEPRFPNSSNPYGADNTNQRIIEEASMHIV